MHSEHNICIKAIHCIPILLVYFIVISVVFSFTKYYFLANNIFILKIFTAPIFYFSAFMTVLNHSYALIVDPGRIPDNYATNSRSNDELGKKEDFCNKCNKSRPERAHHCKICRRCVLKMDHHCPWVANCVGLRNQKFFYLFLFYATLGNLVACCCLAPKVFSIDLNSSFNNEKDMYIKIFDPIMIIIGTFMAFAMTVSIGILFCLQTYLITNNITTIENQKYKNKIDNPYYYNSKWFNLAIVMGFKNKIEWFFPYYEENPYNNQFAFSKANDISDVSDMNFQENENIISKNVYKKVKNPYN